MSIHSTIVQLAHTGTTMELLAHNAPRPRHPETSKWDTIHTVHTVAAVGVLGIGAAVLSMRKGTQTHRLLGRVWAGTMLTTCVSSFGIRDTTGNFSWIHGLSAFTIYSIGAGVYHIRRKNIPQHARFMKGAYIGAVIAGAFAVFTPGRMLYRELFDEPWQN